MTNKYERVEDETTFNPKFRKVAANTPYLGGYYLCADGEASDEEIAKAKEAVVDEICNQIREIAKTRDDFFIVKKGERFPGLDNTIITTVGAKYILPTINDEV